MNYFVGRDDVFAFQTYNKEGKKLCFPYCIYRRNGTGFCQKEIKCSNCNDKGYRGITKNDILFHLQGKEIYGIYPLLDDDCCHFLAFDFDDEDFKESALAFSNICNKYNIDNLIEISGSGNGAHIWIFFKSKIKAYKARKLGSYLLSEAMESDNNIDFRSLDRMFPSQDYLPANGYGNLIILPLQGNKAKDNKTIFIDNNFVPYSLKEQINVLSSTKKVTEEEIDILLTRFKEKDDITILPKNILKNLKISKKDLNDELIINLDNEIIISKDNLSNKAIKFLYRLSSIPNYDYYVASRQRRFIDPIKIPRILSLYKEDDKYIIMPRGCLDDLLKILDYIKVRYIIKNNQFEGNMIPVYFNGTLKEKQKQGLEALLSYNNGLFVAPPAFGKTIVAIALISTLKINTIILVPTITLVNQWLERLDNFLDVGYEYNKNKFGVYYSAKKILTNNIDVVSIDSIDVENDEFLNNYGLVILDEAHHIGAYTYEKVVRLCKSKYIYGFTATPKRHDHKENIIYKTIGNIRYQCKDIDDLSFDKILIFS